MFPSYRNWNGREHYAELIHEEHELPAVTRTLASRMPSLLALASLGYMVFGSTPGGSLAILSGSMDVCSDSPDFRRINLHPHRTCFLYLCCGTPPLMRKTPKKNACSIALNGVLDARKIHVCVC